MKSTHLALPIAASLLSLFAAPAASQISLDMSGGLIGESAVFTLSGPVPAGEFVVLTFSQTRGPLLVSSILPGEPGQWDQDITMFSFPSFFQVAPVVNPLANIPLTFVSPSLVGVHLFAQAWTVPGPTSFLDLTSNDVTLIFGLHGVSTPTLSPPLNSHAFFSQVALTNGDALLAGGGNGIGGAGSGVAEVYDHRAAEFAATANAPAARAGGVAIRLNDGRVLLAGGLDAAGAVTASCEIYDPVTKTFAATGSLTQARALHAGTLLGNGRALVCGGSTSVSGTDVVSTLLALITSATASAESYDPAMGTWSSAGNMSGGARTGHVAATLPDGRALIAGGVAPGVFPPLTIAFTTSAARYNPTTNAWSTTGSMTGSGRALSSVSVLNDGRVMVAGGLNANILALSASALTDVSIYNNTAGTWAAGGALATARYAHSLNTLPDGRLIAAGGNTGSITSTSTSATTVIDSVEAYATGTNSWTTLTPMLQTRSAHGATLTPDGKRIVIVGGVDATGSIPLTAELYVP